MQKLASLGLIPQAAIVALIAMALAFSTNARIAKRIPLVGHWTHTADGIAPNPGDAQSMADSKVEVTVDAFMRARTRPDVIVLDARDASEYEEGHIPGAWCMPAGQDGPSDSMKAMIPYLDRGITYIAYCHGGDCELSKWLIEDLRKQGFPNVQIFTDGMPGYEATKQPVEKGKMAINYTSRGRGDANGSPATSAAPPSGAKP